MSTDVVQEIVSTLKSIQSELLQVQKKVADPEARSIDQFLGFAVQNLERREHVLSHRLKTALTQNDQYHMPEELIAHVLNEIESTRTLKAKIDLVVAHQAAFWGVLRQIQGVLTSAHKVQIKITKVESSEDHTKDRG